MGKSIAEVLGRLQVSIDEYESRITSGTVESISPLLIRKDKLLITEDYIVRSSPIDYLGLKVGQEVILLQANRQQTYYILDIPEESFSDKILKDIDDKIKEIEDVIEFPPVWTIGEDGYWYKDGVKTDTKATGEDGVNGDVWDISGDGYWIKNGIKTDIKAEGEVGRGIKEIKEYFAINNNHLVAPSTGWLEQPVSTSNSNRYLWNYEEIILTDDEILTTTKRVISVHGADGIGISSIKNYYLAYPLSEGVTVSTDGWTETIQVPDSVNKYLWNYEIAFHTDGSQSETIPIVIGNYAKDGDELYTWIKYADTPDSGMSDDPTGKEYMGVAYNKPTDEESEVYSDYRWAKIAGEDGRGIVEVVSYYAINNSEIPPDYESFSTTVLTPTELKKYLWGYEKTTYTSAPLTEDTERRVISVYGEKGEDGNSNFTWIKYADDNQGTNMSDSPEGKRWLGVAANKDTSIESNDWQDYTWSPLYDNSVIMSATAPSNPNVAQLWLDTSVSPNLIKRWTGDSWEIISDIAEINRILDEKVGRDALDTELDNLITQIETSISSSITQTADEFSIQFSEIVTAIETAQDGFNNLSGDIQTNIRFTANGIELGKTNNPIGLVIGPDRISFVEGGQETAYISDNKLYIHDAHILNSLRIGNFAWIPRANGNLSLKKVT